MSNRCFGVNESCPQKSVCFISAQHPSPEQCSYRSRTTHSTISFRFGLSVKGMWCIFNQVFFPSTHSCWYTASYWSSFQLLVMSSDNASFMLAAQTSRHLSMRLMGDGLPSFHLECFWRGSISPLAKRQALWIRIWYQIRYM